MSKDQDYDDDCENGGCWECLAREEEDKCNVFLFIESTMLVIHNFIRRIRGLK